MGRVYPELDELQQRVNYSWQDTGLLRQALVHSSYTYENKDRGDKHNERLEFLGDAVLELIISEYFYRVYSAKPEGELTKMRAMTVCEPSLAGVARRLNLGKYMLMSRGEEKSGGRDRPALLADAFEALLGSVYLDGGIEEARKVALSQLGDVIKQVVAGQTIRDHKTMLQEYLQSKSQDPISYSVIDEAGPDHDKTFTAVVEYQGKIMGKGRGRTKKEAEQQAARMALESYLGR
ncbi:RNAse III [Desulfotomaculum arcticum]|uniref:Ribonuclease 3 n=1 Tax=Desulfotruncus arcticus DSM 17038 TaxID=1121424 RepID=A0A1I2RGV5_9FIRM|nr:ribonuclease III [Desulfotruncus arcticus]SFG39650.1 RNAse III [Desulfotomaculum arcticum] [Desulfotruncus arcticus DSM 17038]